MNRLSRFFFLILALLALAATCNAEGECTTEGECANPDAATADAAAAEETPDVVEESPEVPVEVTSDAAEEATPEETSEEAVSEEAAPEDPHCPSRPYVIRCSGEYLDTNKNGKLERAELQTAIDKLPWYGRGE